MCPDVSIHPVAQRLPAVVCWWTRGEVGKLASPDSVGEGAADSRLAQRAPGGLGRSNSERNVSSDGATRRQYTSSHQMTDGGPPPRKSRQNGAPSVEIAKGMIIRKSRMSGIAPGPASSVELVPYTASEANCCGRRSPWVTISPRVKICASSDSNRWPYASCGLRRRQEPCGGARSPAAISSCNAEGKSTEVESINPANVSALTRKRQSEGTEGPPSDGDCRVQRPVSWPEGQRAQTRTTREGSPTRRDLASRIRSMDHGDQARVLSSR